MIQHEGHLRVVDSSGTRELLVIKILGGSKHKTGDIGDIAVVTVKQAAPDGIVKKSGVVKAIIVRTKSDAHHGDGSYIESDKDAAVVINADKSPRGTRVFGLVARELREHDFMRVVFLALKAL